MIIYPPRTIFQYFFEENRSFHLCVYGPIETEEVFELLETLMAVKRAEIAKMPRATRAMEPGDIGL